MTVVSDEDFILSKPELMVVVNLYNIAHNASQKWQECIDYESSGSNASAGIAGEAAKALEQQFFALYNLATPSIKMAVNALCQDLNHFEIKQGT